jgi:4-hydroxybenzoate polyprenyltransferase/phosphoserine phosphatase
MMSPGDLKIQTQANVPLVVDLDCTLVRTDTLWESIIQLWRMPVVATQAVVALLWRGKSAFKCVVAQAVTIDPATLPYRENVLEFVKGQHSLGREVVLATASHRIVAESVAHHLGLFSRVVATEHETNLTGATKGGVLQQLFGKGGFDYVGDHRKDLPVFAAAREAILVEPSKSLLQHASTVAAVSRVLSEERQDAARVAAKALRIHHWAKNILLAVPLLTAHLVGSVPAWTNISVAFLAFGLAASATYLLNDLADLQSDRLHAQKRFRPLASGQLPIPIGLLLATSLGILAFVISYTLLPAAFRIYLAVYVILTVAYSVDLKHRLFVDVLVLATLYTLRILAGGAAIGVAVSEWLLLFSLFIFVSLAFLKRDVELKGGQNESHIAGRSYSRIDSQAVTTMGISAGLMSVLVFCLYVNSPAVSQLYRSPQVLWLIALLLIYWIARIWFLAARGHIHQDPVVFALSDWRSHVVGAGTLLLLFIAKVGTGFSL